MFGGNSFGQPSFGDGPDGAIDPGRGVTLQIPNKFVGPMALLYLYHPPTAVGHASLNAQSAQTATLTFTGAQPKITGYPQTETLTITGVFAKLTKYPLVAAVLSFTGAFVKKPIRALTGVLSFTGAFKKTDNKVTSGTLTFTGAQSKFTTYPLVAAVLSFTGAMFKRTSRAFTGGISFSGTFIAGINILFGATLTFSGAMNRTVFYPLTAVLSFVGGFGRGFFKKFTATLGFLGGFGHSANVQRTGTLWQQNPAYLQGAHKYDDANTLFDAAIPFDGAVTANITSVYPQTGQLWAPYIQNRVKTIWAENANYLKGAVGYDDPNTLFDAAIPFDGTNNLSSIYSPPATIYTEDNFL